MDFLYEHPFIRRYLEYVENTESPRIFHAWAALSGVSAAMGRRCWIERGTGKLYPNHFIVLTGPPATRKSTAVKIMQRLLRENTGVRFAPDDTGGQRQGLITAMTRITTDEVEDTKLLQGLVIDTGTAASFNSISADEAIAKVGALPLDVRDPRTMFACANELNSLLGENNTQILTFLQSMWDGEPYKYQLRKDEYILDDALLGLIGATTPSQISLALPPQAVGGGFTSRIIFVYAGKKHSRLIPRPTLDEDAGRAIADIYRKVFYEFEGPFRETKAAATLYDRIYMEGITLKDPRFVNYCDRRNTAHLLKLAMVLAASRGQRIIDEQDMAFADQLLTYTEAEMPDALGEYGMNKLSHAKQRLLEYINAADGAVPVQALYGLMAKDMSQLDYRNSINELSNAKKVSLLSVPDVDGTTRLCVIAVSDTPARQRKREFKDLLAKIGPEKEAAE